MMRTRLGLGSIVVLGIVAVGQTFVMLGASIDLSVAYMISVTAVGASYLMAGDPGRVWWTVLVLDVYKRQRSS